MGGGVVVGGEGRDMLVGAEGCVCGVVVVVVVVVVFGGGGSVGGGCGVSWRLVRSQAGGGTCNRLVLVGTHTMMGSSSVALQALTPPPPPNATSPSLGT